MLQKQKCKIYFVSAFRDGNGIKSVGIGNDPGHFFGDVAGCPDQGFAAGFVFYMSAQGRHLRRHLRRPAQSGKKENKNNVQSFHQNIV